MGCDKCVWAWKGEKYKEKEAFGRDWIRCVEKRKRDGSRKTILKKKFNMYKCYTYGIPLIQR